MYRFVISGFRCDVNEICALLQYYAAFSGGSVPTFRDKGKEVEEVAFLLGLIDT
jgi:hypothetical protein